MPANCSSFISHLSDVAGLREKAEVETLQDQSLNMLQHQVSSNLSRTNTRYARYQAPHLSLLLSPLPTLQVDLGRLQPEKHLILDY